MQNTKYYAQIKACVLRKKFNQQGICCFSSLIIPPVPIHPSNSQVNVVGVKLRATVKSFTSNC